MQIYIVEESTGSYEDKMSIPVRAFTSKEKAKAFAKEKNNNLDALFEKYDNIDHLDVERMVLFAFNRYLMESDKEYYDYLPIEIKKDPYTNADLGDFDYDEYYNRECDFETKKDLVLKYLKKEGYEENEINEYKLVTEVNDKYFHDKPYYYVSRQPIELEED